MGKKQTDKKEILAHPFSQNKNHEVERLLEESGIPFVWGFNSVKALENVRKARAFHNMRHGMYSGVPIVCQGNSCPFRATCWIEEDDLDVGGRCPIEVGAVLERFDKYCREFDIKDDDTVDHSIIKDIIDIEILMLRADNYLAVSGDFIEEVITGVDARGNVLTRPELHKAFEAKNKLRLERIKLLNQMNSTRKDKKVDILTVNDPSSRAAELIQKVRRLQEEGKIIDVTPKDKEE